MTMIICVFILGGLAEYALQEMELKGTLLFWRNKRDD